MEATKKLMKIDTRLAEARQALRAVTEEERRAQAELKTAEAALAEHFAQETVDELEPRELHNRLTAARNRAEQPWAQRREGKQQLVKRLEAERDQCVIDNLGALAASREHDAHAARDAVVSALEAIEVAERAWADVERYYTDLLRPVPGVDGRDVPRLNLSAVKSEVQRALDHGIPAPLPRSIFGGEGDPTLRSAA